MGDAAGDEPRVPEQLGGLSDAPRHQRLTDRPRGNDAAAVGERRHDIDAESVPLALRGEERRRAGAPLAEMKVEADHRPAHRKPLEQYAGNKLLGGEARQRCIEGEHDGAVEPGRGEKTELGALVGKAEQ